MFFAKSQTLLKTASVLPKTTVMSQKKQPQTTTKNALILKSQTLLNAALAAPKATVISQKNPTQTTTNNLKKRIEISLILPSQAPLKIALNFPE